MVYAPDVPTTKRGKHRYADAQIDLRQELERFSRLNAYVTTQYADARCSCDSTRFSLAIDEEAGVAIRTCTRCGTAHPIGDSAEYLDVRWIYVACRCTACSLAGVYGDWKSESQDYETFLRRV